MSFSNRAAATGGLALALALAAIITAAPRTGRADTLARVSGAGKLSSGQRQVARASLDSLTCYAPGHGGTLAHELSSRPPCRTAARLARYVIFLAGKDLTAEQVAKVIDLRRQSVHPQRTFTITTAGAPLLGDPRAPVTIVEYADFECPHCVHVSPALEEVVRGLKGKAVLYFKPYPLRFEGSTLLAAKAALAAHRQGKFWQLAALLFKRPKEHTRTGVEAMAKKAGCDLDRFRAALLDINLAKQLERYKIEGLRLGLKGTPTLFFNGKLYRLRKDAMHFRERIEEELELLKAR